MAEGYEVYKVVRKDEFDKNSLVSCFAPPELELKYQIGIKTNPKVGKLFCFDNLKSAINFTRTISMWNIPVILLCETNSFVSLNSTKIIPEGSRHVSARYEYADFWENPQIWGESYEGNYLPGGTVFCDYVIPIEEVVYER